MDWSNEILAPLYNRREASDSFIRCRTSYGQGMPFVIPETVACLSAEKLLPIRKTAGKRTEISIRKQTDL